MCSWWMGLKIQEYELLCLNFNCEAVSLKQGTTKKINESQYISNQLNDNKLKNMMTGPSGWWWEQEINGTKIKTTCGWNVSYNGTRNDTTMSVSIHLKPIKP